MTTISVIIATYGEDAWEIMALERALPSVYSESPDQVVGEHLRDATIAEARNAGAAQATGEWLLFVDADDELAPGYLGAMRRAIESLDPDMDGLGTARRGVAGQAEAWVPPLLTPSVQQVRKGRPGKPFFFPECSLTTGNWLIIGTLISRDLFTRIGGFSEHPHGLEDFNLWAKAVKAGANIVKVPDAIYVAHMNPKSKHHQLQRNRAEYMRAYEAARSEVWG